MPLSDGWTCRWSLSVLSRYLQKWRPPVCFGMTFPSGDKSSSLFSVCLFVLSLSFRACPMSGSTAPATSQGVFQVSPDTANRPRPSITAYLPQSSPPALDSRPSCDRSFSADITKILRISFSDAVISQPNKRYFQSALQVNPHLSFPYLLVIFPGVVESSAYLVNAG